MFQYENDVTQLVFDYLKQSVKVGVDVQMCLLKFDELFAILMSKNLENRDCFNICNDRKEQTFAINGSEKLACY